jgi:hypothetical protein
MGFFKAQSSLEHSFILCVFDVVNLSVATTVAGLLLSISSASPACVPDQTAAVELFMRRCGVEIQDSALFNTRRRESANKRLDVKCSGGWGEECAEHDSLRTDYLVLQSNQGFQIYFRDYIVGCPRYELHLHSYVKVCEVRVFTPSFGKSSTRRR